MGTEKNRQIVADLYAAFGHGDIGAVIDSLTPTGARWTGRAPASDCCSCASRPTSTSS